MPSKCPWDLRAEATSALTETFPIVKTLISDAESWDITRLPMKILLVNDTIGARGGVQTYLDLLKESLEGRGHAVELFGPRRESRPSDYLKGVWNIASWLRLRRKTREFRPDVIHYFGIGRYHSASVLFPGRKARRVMSFRDTHLCCPETWLVRRSGAACSGIGWTCLNGGCYRSAIRLKYLLYHYLNLPILALHRLLIKLRVQAFITNSGYMAALFQESLQVNRITVLPHFIRKSDLRFERLRHTKIVLYIGRLSPEKGVEIALRAFPKVLQRVPEAKLVIAGSGPILETLRRRAEELSISDRVDFAGWVEKPETTYSGADVVIIPSICQDAFPWAALEAMSRGRPVIAGEVGGLPEIIEPGRNGYLFPLGDSAALADRIVALLTDEIALEAFSKKAFEKANTYREDNHYDHLLRIYRS